MLAPNCSHRSFLTSSHECSQHTVLLYIMHHYIHQPPLPSCLSCAGNNRKINAIMELVRWGANAGTATHPPSCSVLCLCALCSVLCALCSVLCPLCSVLCALSSVLCPLCFVLCALCSVLCPLYLCTSSPTYTRTYSFTYLLTLCRDLYVFLSALPSRESR